MDLLTFEKKASSFSLNCGDDFVGVMKDGMSSNGYRFTLKKSDNWIVSFEGTKRRVSQKFGFEILKIDAFELIAQIRRNIKSVVSAADLATVLADAAEMLEPIVEVEEKEVS
jgi:hypothetical protein